MFPSAFDYHRAASVDDAIAVLSANPEAKILAGGYSLIPAMKLRLANPAMLVDLTRLEELKGVEIGDETVTIGAMTTYDQLRDTPGIAELFPSVIQSIGVIGDQQVRANGTIGGTLAHNDPAADFTAVFSSLRGSVVVKGPNGERSISADQLFVDLWTTALEADEVITSVILPKPAPGTVAGYRKHQHPASGYAIVGLAAAVTVVDGLVSAANIVVTGATSIATHAAAAEEALVDKPLDADSITVAADVAAQDLDLNPSPYASEAYLSQLVKVLTGRVLNAAIEA
ncbi:MAG TPA: xanthine dehydrogenase family protein subunit M [Thermomicrobiales bacterium]|nr:xanthine dehydrogenase family protein subunit M [Thermomicrobiales bacterium]